MSRSSFILTIAIFLSASLSAQITQPDRVEFLLNNTYDNFILIPAGENGLFLLKEGKAVKDQVSWEIIRLDTTFNLIWKRNYTIARDYVFVDHYFNEGKAFALFSNFSSNSKNLKLLTFDIDGQLTDNDIKNFIPFTFFDFIATPESLLIGGNFNYRPIVILYNLSDKIPRVLPGIFTDKAGLIELKANDNKTFDILLGGKTADKSNTLFLHTFDMNGNLIKKITLDSDRLRGPIFGKSETLNEYSQIIAGVYGRNNSNYTRGIFIANVNELGEQKINYYNYGDLKNFFNYMRAKREQRVLNRIERRKIKEKKIKFNYRLMVHDIVEHGDQFILLGEAFYPKYKSVSSTQSGFFSSGSAINRGLYASNLIFDGYRYTHAVVIGFDSSGKLLWDNSFEINDVTSFDLEQFVQVSTSDEEIVLLYVYEDKLRSKIIKGDDVIEGKELIDIALKFSADQIVKKTTSIRGMEKWYDNTFYIYGTQTVSNLRDDGVELKRDVFFINKVIYK